MTTATMPAPPPPAPPVTPPIAPPPQLTGAGATTHARLAAIVDTIRRREFDGIFPGPLDTVMAIYLELAQAPDANAVNLEACIAAAAENWRELQRLGTNSPPGLVKNLEVIDL
jgi:hypothetical protein